MPSQISPSTAFLNKTFNAVLMGSDSEQTIAKVLELTGRYLRVSRVYLVESDKKTFFTSHEWCREGIPPSEENPQPVSLPQFYVYYHHFDKDNIFAVSDTANISGRLHDTFLKKGIRALLQTAFVINERIVAMLGVDECEQPREWTGDEISTLTLLMQHLGMNVLNPKGGQRSRLNKSLAFDILNVVADKLYVIDVETHNLLYVNDALTKIIPELQLGKPCYHFFEPGATGPCSFCPVETFHRNPVITNTAFDVRNPRLDVWSSISSTIIEWFDGRKICVIRATDVTEKRDHEVKLEQLAYTDELTDIPNNRSYRHTGPILLTSATEQNLNVAVIALKVESLHRINSTTGYEQGDSILKDFAEKVSRAVPGESIFARVRGNDFAILYPYNKSHDKLHVQAQVQRICLAVSEVRVPSSVRGRLSVATGISIFPDDGTQFEDLNRKAGLALALNKSLSSISYAFYDATVAAEQLASDKLAQELAVALHNDELEIYYQPKYDVSTCRISGTEALLRWHHPKHGLMPGGAFIQLAEDHSLISDIDDWVINETCRNIRQLWNAGCKPVPVALNLSPDKFYQDDILGKLTSAMKRYGISPELLEVEITERIALEDINKATTIMRHIRALGITLSIDDFGTGYSSLNYLRILPIDAVKLDRSFLTDIEHSPTARNIVDFIVKLAGLLRFSVIMEGIETREQFEFARQLKCDVVQGYFTGRPVPLEELKQLLIAPEALPNLPRNSPLANSLLRYLSPSSVLLWLLALGGAVLGAVTMGGVLVQTFMGSPSDTLSGLHLTLAVAGFSVMGFATLTAFLVWKCRSLSMTSKQIMRDMIRMCKDACRGGPLPDEIPQWHMSKDLLTELGNELAMTTRKIRVDSAELLKCRSQCEVLASDLLRWQAVQRITAESVSDILWEIDLPAQQVRFSPRFMNLFGHAKREFVYPEEFLTLVHPDDCEMYNSRISVLTAGEVAGKELEFRLMTVNSTYILVRSIGAVMYNEQGGILSFVGALSEISSRENAPLREDSRNDPLTGLLNRSKGEHLVLHRIEEKQTSMALFLIDITEFKSINKQFGRLCGDSVLRRLAQRLETFCLPGDVLFRYGGDEFALLKTDCTNTGAVEQCAEGIISSLNKPCVHHKVNIPIHCDIAAIFVEPQVVVTGPELFRQAKQIMQVAHETGVFSLQSYTPPKTVALPWEMDE